MRPADRVIGAGPGSRPGGAVNQGGNDRMRPLLAKCVLATLASVVCAAGSAAAATGDQNPILIGLIAGTTGAYGTTGIATVHGAEMAVDKVNAAGGVLGRPFKLDWHNDDASATLSGQLFAKLVGAGAVVIAGSPDIGVVDDGGLTVNPKGPAGPPNPWVFDFGLNTFAWGAKIGEYALKHCPGGLAVLHDPTTYGNGGNYGIQMVYQKAGKKIAIDRA